MNTAKKLRDAIFLSIGCAAVGIGCGEKESTDSANTDGGGNTSSLASIPDGEYPDCTPAQSEFEGDCCIDVYCYTPEEGTCPDSESANAASITGLGLGSGDCLCSSVEGPYSPERADEYTDTTGDCCYLVGVQGCEGRPMFVEENIRKAPLVHGKRWSA